MNKNNQGIEKNMEGIEIKINENKEEIQNSMIVILEMLPKRDVEI